MCEQGIACTVVRQVNLNGGAGSKVRSPSGLSILGQAAGEGVVCEELGQALAQSLPRARVV